jgi:hypothetical protein
MIKKKGVFKADKYSADEFTRCVPMRRFTSYRAICSKLEGLIPQDEIYGNICDVIRFNNSHNQVVQPCVFLKNHNLILFFYTNSKNEPEIEKSFMKGCICLKGISEFFLKDKTLVFPYSKIGTLKMNKFCEIYASKGPIEKTIFIAK